MTTLKERVKEKLDEKDKTLRFIRMKGKDSVVAEEHEPRRKRKIVYDIYEGEEGIELYVKSRSPWMS